ncbi:MAG: T9SS type A sorting domain-containing protein, partial [Bacteroidales bacterium]
DAEGLEVVYSVEPNTCSINGNEITFLQAGDYSITVSQEGNEKYNAAEKSFYIEAFKSVAISELKNEQIKVFPNPVNDYLYISLDGFETYELTIYDLKGNKIFVEKSSSSLQRINVYNWNLGVYLLEIKTEKYRIRKKIIR